MTGLLKILWQASSSCLRQVSLVAGGQFDFEVFADVDGADALVAHLFQGVGDGFALRVEHGLFGCDNNFCFHANRTEGCWVKMFRRASFFWPFGTGFGLRLGL